MIRAIGQLYVSSDLSRQMVGVNWDVTADVKLTEDLTRSKALTEARNAELEAARARIEYNSLHDFLTRLPNRMYLERALAEHAARCAKSGGGVALLQVDLDGFKQINDTLGHSAGDAMLIHTAETIRRHLRPGDFVARTGGDEFVVVCNADGGMAGFDDLARRIIDDVSRPIDHDGHECRLGMSIGIAGAYGADVDRQRLLVDADLALYRAKSLGRNRFEFYTAALQAEIVDAKRTGDSIIGGLERGEFIPYFQPQVDARTLEIVGVEALARWRHPTRGVLAPAAFINIAEELAVIAAIDRAVLEGALACHRRWRAEGLRPPRLSVNVSLRRLHEEGLIDALSALEIAPGELSFELVEFDLSRRTRRPLLRKRRADQGARHRHRDRRFRQRLCVDRQPDQDQAAAAEDRPPADHADRALRRSAPPRSLDRRNRPLARHRSRGRRGRDDGARRAAARLRLLDPPGLRLRQADGGRGARGAAAHAPATDRLGSRRRRLAFPPNEKSRPRPAPFRFGPDGRLQAASCRST